MDKNELVRVNSCLRVNKQKLRVNSCPQISGFKNSENLESIKQINIFEGKLYYKKIKKQVLVFYFGPRNQPTFKLPSP